jgi:Skp family chaperone for outer membrane proteins
MKQLFAPMMIGILAIVGTSPAAAQSKSDQGTSVGVATTHDSTTERNSYRQKAQEEMQIWQKKLQDFDTKIQAKATEAQASASKDLDDAWTETKSASSQLETAAEADWDAAKASFKKASDRLTVAWHRVNPADK